MTSSRSHPPSPRRAASSGLAEPPPSSQFARLVAPKRTRRSGGLVALLTDFGPASDFAGILHGVIARTAPAVRVIDLSHSVPPQQIAAGAVSLESAIGFFPDDTVFCAVVDPGVGSERRCLAIRAGRYWFVGPDNGLFTLALERIESAARRADRTIECRSLLGSRAASAAAELPSATFHGRDVFAPAAAYIATEGEKWFRRHGMPIPRDSLMGLPGRKFDFPPKPREHRLRVPALCCDSFGNLIYRVRRDELEAFWIQQLGGVPEPKFIEVRLGARKLRTGLSRTFADVKPGDPVVYWGSGGRLELAVRNESAIDVFDDELPQIELRW